VAKLQYKRDFEALEARRREGMRLLGRGVKQADIARRLTVSRQTVSSWAKAREAAPRAWRNKTLGRPGGLTEIERKRLSRLLVDGAVAAGFATELWTLRRVVALIEKELGRSYSTVHAWRLLKSLGFSNQRPVGRAVERDEAAIAEWKAKRWPALKKKPAGKAAPSSS
jgi:transposase